MRNFSRKIQLFDQRAGAADQRLVMCADEISLLSEASALLKDKVKVTHESANERAFVQKASPSILAAGRPPSFLQTLVRK